MLNAGCGVGNSLFNLKNAKGCDYSSNAISLAKEKLPHLSFFVYDLTSDEKITEKFDVIFLIFTLSSIDPLFHKKVFFNVKEMLNEDGLIIFKDFGFMDYRQNKYKSEQIVKEDFYRRGDGTFTYFFKEDYLIKIAEEVGLVSDIKTENTLTVNRKKMIEMFRVTIKGTFKNEINNLN